MLLQIGLIISFLMKIQISHAYSNYKWRTSRWGDCSVACGDGGQRMRSVRCANADDNMEWVEDSYCSDDTRPTNVTNCDQQQCAQWDIGKYGAVRMKLRHRAVKPAFGFISSKQSFIFLVLILLINNRCLYLVQYDVQARTSGRMPHRKRSCR